MFLYMFLFFILETKKCFDEVDASKCKCFLERDRQKLLGTHFTTKTIPHKMHVYKHFVWNNICNTLF